MHRFLHDPSCADYKYYDSRVREMEAKLGKAAGGRAAALQRPGLCDCCQQQFSEPAAPLVLPRRRPCGSTCG